MILTEYHYCPQCQQPLTQEATSAHCSNCSFVYYDNPAPCVSLVIEQDQQVLLGKRAIEPEKGKWDVIGGFVNPGETFEQAALREAKEELGVEIKLGDYLGNYPDVYGQTGEATLVSIYRAQIVSGQPHPMDDVAELKWFPLDQLPKSIAFKTVTIGLEQLKKARKPA